MRLNSLLLCCSTTLSAHLARAGAAQRVSQRNGATIGVDLVNVDAQLVHAVGGLRTRQ